MGVRKIDALLRQRVHVWCFHLRMSAQETRPVVHVVNRDEQDIRSVLRGSDAAEQHRDQKNSDEHTIGPVR